MTLNHVDWEFPLLFLLDLVSQSTPTHWALWGPSAVTARNNTIWGRGDSPSFLAYRKVIVSSADRPVNNMLMFAMTLWTLNKGPRVRGQNCLSQAASSKPGMSITLMFNLPKTGHVFIRHLKIHAVKYQGSFHVFWLEFLELHWFCICLLVWNKQALYVSPAWGLSVLPRSFNSFPCAFLGFPPEVISVWRVGTVS